MPVIDELISTLDSSRVLTDPDRIASYVHDEAEWAPYSTPLAVVRATSTDDVQRTVRWALQHDVPLVPRGAGTGLSGGANSTDGCVVVSLEKMNAVLEVNPLERIAVVQPGVVNDDLRKTVGEQGLWYPPDPASSPWSTIGGNVATNAGGVCCVKYGVTRDYVIGLEVVTGTGEVVRLGRRTAKGVAGLDLAGLFVGSEGTLGIVTEITVKLRPLPDPGRTVLGYFDSIVDAGVAVRDVAARGLTPSALEIVDRICLEAVDEMTNMGLAAEANVVLIGKLDEPGEAGVAAAQEMVAAFQTGGATFVAETSDAEEADAMMAARRLAYPAMERKGPLLTEDIVVAKEHVPEMLRRIEQISAEVGITIASVAHAGDGNLHPLMVAGHDDDDERERAQAAFDRIIDECLKLGGTVTGEHGVGLLKMPGAARELGPEVIAMQRAVKAALDPHGIFNPGKVF
ncbi:MAG TPA: FAD-linked oxidase C-terminal domain-containing protein [Flexivirga sp.]|uniref:FAD-binding oxidoreductase n=1 Tax=Flexivirga sp. TaxID=1962927 RepID=UPI002BFE015B|nr:FAD-linked oxidase C-terminal domain-containing protein [Flexivirga sp.]HWC20973.1 FAD-linked oxidase C-terminal domain-containing protein [Flexivirga sp.]